MPTGCPAGRATHLQDDWRATPNLSLNLGLPWSYESRLSTKYGQQSQFDPASTDPVSGRLGAIIHPTGKLAGRDLNNFQPRVGVVYKLNKKMVFRGGFGVNAIDLYTVGLDQNFEEFTQFGSVNLWSNFGHSSYHSGTAKVEKRLSRGLNLTSFYTWAKTMDESDNDGGASGVTFYNRRLEKARAGFDINHRSITYLTYQLPFGSGRKWMKRSGLADHLLGGWNLSWVQAFQTGTPVTFSQAGSPNRYLPSLTIRPNQLVPNDQVIVPNWTIGGWFVGIFGLKLSF